MYRLKFIEKNTQNPLFCPVPTCSVFIPPRLFRQPKETTTVSDEGELAGPNNPEDSTVIATPTTKINVTCPKCQALICTSCRALTHDEDECPQEEIDPALMKLLEKAKIKRCPKCRDGIRKMFGCNHVE